MSYNTHMQQLKVMSFNIGGDLVSTDGIKSWDNRKKSCIAMLKKFKADIVGFQEVQKGNRAMLASALSDYEFEYGLKSVSKKSSESYFNPIYWKTSAFEKLGAGAFYLSDTPYKWSRGWDAKDVRSVTWVRLIHLATKDTFSLLNLHLDHRGIMAREKSGELIIGKLGALRKQFNDTTFVFGDFNERAWQPKNEQVESYPYPILPEYIPLQNNVYNKFIGNGYKDSYIMSGKTNKLDMNTYHDYFGSDFPSVAMRIDWILFKEAKRKCKVEDFCIIKSDPNYPSDHFPVIAKFSF